eukprot:350902-Chlamydomonas_euryale.AAC.2
MPRLADDPTYVGGLLVTLQSLLESLDSIQSKRTALAGLLAQHGSGAKSSVQGWDLCSCSHHDEQHGDGCYGASEDT